jgi:hypothetical protein
MSVDVYAEIQAIVDAADDPDRLRHEALRLCQAGDATSWRPGDPTPDNSLDGRWRRALAADPSGLLATLQRQHPPSSAKVFGRRNEYELVLPDGAGKLLIKFVPGRG